MFLADFFERLGMSEQLKGKTVLARNTAQTAEFVASGKADFGMSQLSELRAPGIDVVARFPKGIGGDIVISAAVIAGTKQSDAATALVRFLSSPTLAAAIKKHRLEPVTPYSVLTAAMLAPCRCRPLRKHLPVRRSPAQD